MAVVRKFLFDNDFGAGEGSLFTILIPLGGAAAGKGA